MLELTREEAIHLHRVLWDIISKDPKKSKDDALVEINIDPNTVSNQCFLCEYGFNHVDIFLCGDSCILSWGEEGTSCVTSDSLFQEFCDTYDLKEKSRLAAIIRDLPENK